MEMFVIDGWQRNTHDQVLLTELDFVTTLHLPLVVKKNSPFVQVVLLLDLRPKLGDLLQAVVHRAGDSHVAVVDPLRLVLENDQRPCQVERLAFPSKLVELASAVGTNAISGLVRVADFDNHD